MATRWSPNDSEAVRSPRENKKNRPNSCPISKRGKKKQVDFILFLNLAQVVKGIGWPLYKKNYIDLIFLLELSKEQKFMFHYILDIKYKVATANEKNVFL